ncbi:hypothetical protein BpHYR1_018622 [Brachionus plicatilis]|uniref:Uncharacterized protein n=1 Tax=Brachionus plicatilis TaxID=10195 RepID=A0A3M7SJI4_BRAPC|nr:hypothetical protein BpHYR1_018622 [Brachionus plicatilis]
MIIFFRQASPYLNDEHKNAYLEKRMRTTQTHISNESYLSINLLRRSTKIKKMQIRVSVKTNPSHVAIGKIDQLKEFFSKSGYIIRPHVSRFTARNLEATTLLSLTLLDLRLKNLHYFKQFLKFTLNFNKIFLKPKRYKKIGLFVILSVFLILFKIPEILDLLSEKFFHDGAPYHSNILFYFLVQEVRIKIPLNFVQS